MTPDELVLARTADAQRRAARRGLAMTGAPDPWHLNRLELAALLVASTRRPINFDSPDFVSVQTAELLADLMAVDPEAAASARRAIEQSAHGSWVVWLAINLPDPPNPATPATTPQRNTP